MKKIYLTMLFTLSICLSNAQSRRFYCEVKGIEKELSSGLKIIFDFGDKASYNIWGDLSSKLKFVDENGEDINMVNRGWIFQQAYSSSYGAKPVIHWIFYKDAKNFEEARKGITTRDEHKKANK